MQCNDFNFHLKIHCRLPPDVYKQSIKHNGLIFSINRNTQIRNYLPGIFTLFRNFSGCLFPSVANLMLNYHRNYLVI